MVDIDETVALHDLSDFPASEYVDVPYVRGPFTVVPHRKNINLLKKFHKLGYQLIFWSATGADWAESVCKTLGLDEIAFGYLSKPRYYFDDKDASSWIGHKIYRHPKTGEEAA
jgi:hypothetical protein